jgi:hypothetical protein
MNQYRQGLRCDETAVLHDGDGAQLNRNLDVVPHYSNCHRRLPTRAEQATEQRAVARNDE